MNEEPPELSTKDLLKYNPVKLLVDKHGALKLDATQRSTLAHLNDSVGVNVARLVARIDTAQKSLTASMDARAAQGGRGRGRGAGRADGTRGRILATRQSILTNLDSLAREEDGAKALALAALRENQRPKAAALIARQDKDLRKKLDESGYLNRLPPTTPRL